PDRPDADLPVGALAATPPARGRRDPVASAGNVCCGGKRMKVTGEATLRAGHEEVYGALVDPAMLVRTIPGCQQLVQVGEDSYRATVLAGVASIKGVYDGQVRV